MWRVVGDTSFSIASLARDVACGLLLLDPLGPVSITQTALERKVAERLRNVLLYSGPKACTGTSQASESGVQVEVVHGSTEK
jgi:hypothetical protein